MSARDPSGAGEKSSTRLIASNGFGMFMLGIALALGGAFASQSVAKAIITSRSASSIKVKGSASIDLRADSARWVTTVTCRGTTLQAAYASLSKDMQRLQKFMSSNTFIATVGFTVLPMWTAYAASFQGTAWDARGKPIIPHPKMR